MDTEFVKSTFFQYGRILAENLQKESPSMTGTELNSKKTVIPQFAASCAVKNMINRKAGFTCISPSGRVVSLIQPYDSDVFDGSPEDLPAQWRFVWSKDPEHSKPFISLSTSPYDTGDVCEQEGVVYSSKIDGNTWPPKDNPRLWKVAKKRF